MCPQPGMVFQPALSGLTLFQILRWQRYVLLQKLGLRQRWSREPNVANETVSCCMSV